MREIGAKSAKRPSWLEDRSAKQTVRLLVGTAMLILATEVFAMAVVEILWPGGFWRKTLIDEGILLGVTLPTLYFAVFRPLLHLLAERKQSEEALALRARELGARNAINMVAARELGTEAVLSKVVDVLLSVFEADGGWVLLLAQEPESPARFVGVRGVSPVLLPAASAELFLDNPTCCGGLLARLPQGEVTLVSECRHLPREVLMAAGFGGYVGVPLPAGRRVRAILNLVWRAPRQLSDADRALLGAIARNIGIAAESAAMYEAEQKARQAADTIAAVSLSLNETLDLEKVIQTLFDHIGRFAPHDRAKVMLLESESRLRVQAVFSPTGSADTAGKVPARFDVRQNPLVSEVLKTHRSLYVADMHAHPAVTRQMQPHEEHSWLGVPLLAEGRAVGVLTLVKAGPGSYTAEHVKLAEALCAPASVAIANALLFGEVVSGRKRLETLSRQLVEVQETERRHIAHELHDEIGQALTAILYRLEALKNLQPRPFGDILDETIGIADRTIRSVRDLSLDLRPALLDEAGLAETLRWYIDRQVKGDSLEVSLNVWPERPELSRHLTIACFRIVQEALTNVVRHAKARRVDIRLSSSGTRVEVAVCDDGRGFDVDDAHGKARSGRSLGILGMRERAELLGGKLVVDSAPGRGTTVRASLPLHEPAEPVGGP